MANGGSSLLESLSKAIDEVNISNTTRGFRNQLLLYSYDVLNLLMQVVKLGECEIYSYNPDFDGDPFLEKGAMYDSHALCLLLVIISKLRCSNDKRMSCRWSFNFFFYNRKLKRIVSFRCCCLRLVYVLVLFLW